MSDFLLFVQSVQSCQVWSCEYCGSASNDLRVVFDGNGGFDWLCPFCRNECLKQEEEGLR